MGVISWSQNSTHLQPLITLQTSAGTALDMTGLTGTAIVLKSRVAEQISAYTTLSGTATMVNAGLGQFSYKFALADVATAGNYKLIVMVTFGVNDVWTSFEQDFLITQTQ